MSFQWRRRVPNPIISAVIHSAAMTHNKDPFPPKILQWVPFGHRQCHELRGRGGIFMDGAKTHLLCKSYMAPTFESQCDTLQRQLHPLVGNAQSFFPAHIRHPKGDSPT
uniref:Uncharacterized protein n=1 Tax=Sphaerodactylus townsendi TaxID=933632 RepID=A0ACB8FZ08_9SAUR